MRARALPGAMVSRALVAVVVASLVLNVALLVLVMDVLERVEGIQTTSAPRHRLEGVSQEVRLLADELRALERAAGIVSRSEAAPDLASGSCAGVPVHFAAELARFPAHGNATLVAWPTWDYLGGSDGASMPGKMVTDAPRREAPALRTSATRLEAVLNLSDVHDYAYQWLVATPGGGFERSAQFEIRLGAELGGGRHGLGYRNENGTVHLRVDGGPDTPVCERVERLELVVAPEGDARAYTFERGANETWTAQVPDYGSARTELRWHLKDGRIVRETQAALPSVVVSYR